MGKIDSFFGEYRWLSNYWLCVIVYQGVTYKSVEHAYQSLKVDDPVLANKIANSSTPNQAKKLAQAPVQRRPNWEQTKVSVMKDLLRIKFSDPVLRAKLLATGDAELVEGNTWGDTFWGVCRGIGQNHLGKLLMEVRAEIVAEGKK